MILTASGFQTNVGVEAVLDVTCEQSCLTLEEGKKIQELCQCVDV